MPTSSSLWFSGIMAISGVSGSDPNLATTPPPTRSNSSSPSGRSSPALRSFCFFLLCLVPDLPALSDVRNLPRPAVFLGGYGLFVAVTAEAFAASRRSWRRSLPLRGGHGGGLLYIDTKTTQKIASHATSAFFITGTCLGFAPHRGTCAARRFFRRNHRKKREKAE